MSEGVPDFCVWGCIFLIYTYIYIYICTVSLIYHGIYIYIYIMYLHSCIFNDIVDCIFIDIYYDVL